MRVVPYAVVPYSRTYTHTHKNRQTDVHPHPRTPCSHFARPTQLLCCCAQWCLTQTHTLTHTHQHTHTHTHAHTHTHTHTNRRTPTHTHIPCSHFARPTQFLCCCAQWCLTQTHTESNRCTPTHTHRGALLNTYRGKQMYTNTHTHTHTHRGALLKHIQRQTDVHQHTHTPTYTHTHTNTCKQTYTHTHAHALQPLCKTNATSLLLCVAVPPCPSPLLSEARLWVREAVAAWYVLQLTFRIRRRAMTALLHIHGAVAASSRAEQVCSHAAVSYVCCICLAGLHHSYMVCIRSFLLGKSPNVWSYTVHIYAVWITLCL